MKIIVGLVDGAPRNSMYGRHGFKTVHVLEKKIHDSTVYSKSWQNHKV